MFNPILIVFMQVHGSDGHKNTVKYFKKTLESLGDYYTIELQEYATEVTLASSETFSVDGVGFATSSFEFGNNGTWTDVPLANVANLGCNPVSYDGAFSIFCVHYSLMSR